MVLKEANIKEYCLKIHEISWITVHFWHFSIQNSLSTIVLLYLNNRANRGISVLLIFNTTLAVLKCSIDGAILKWYRPYLSERFTKIRVSNKNRCTTIYLTHDNWSVIQHEQKMAHGVTSLINVIQNQPCIDNFSSVHNRVSCFTNLNTSYL